MTNKSHPDIKNLKTLLEKSKKLPGDMYYKATITPPHSSGSTFHAKNYFYGNIDATTVLLGRISEETPYKQFYLQFPVSTPDGKHQLGHHGETDISATIMLDNDGFYELEGTIEIERNRIEKSITGTADIKGKPVNGNTDFRFGIKFHLDEGATTP